MHVRQASATPYSSKLHQSVSETLTTMKIQHVNEVPVFGGVYHLDIVLCHPEAGCLAIEVDGPSHFVHLSRQGRSSKYLKFNPETRLKRRLLKRLGWKVTSLRALQPVPVPAPACVEGALRVCYVFVETFGLF